MKKKFVNSYVNIILLLLIINKVIFSNSLDSLKQIELKNREDSIQEKIDTFKENNLQNPNKLQEKIDIIDDNQPKILINKINILGVYNYQKEIESLKKTFEGKPVSLDQINSLSKTFTDFFLLKGDIGTKVIFTSGNILKKELTFTILPGRVNSIEIYDDGTRNILKEKINIPINPNDILNIEKLDQALENLSVGNWSYSVHILPHNENNNIDSTTLKWNIIIFGERKDSNLVLGVDNNSYKNLGEYQWYSNFQYGNLLGLSDLWNFSSIDRITKDRSSHRETATNLSFEIPIKTFKIKYSLEHGYNKNKIRSLSEYTIKSKVQSHKLTLQKLIHRNKTSRTNLISNFYLRDYNTTFNDLKIDVNSKRYSFITFGLENLKFFQGGVLYFLIEIEKGVPWFESEKNTKQNKLSGYDMAYEKINFLLNWEKYIGNNFLYTLKSGGIYSENRLLTINQFNTGSLYTVRGFKENSVNGNKALYFNNTLWYTLYPLDYVNLTPFIGGDIGWSRDKDLNYSDNLIGFTTGIELTYKNLTGKLAYGKPIKVPNGLKKEKNIIYLSTYYKF